MDELSNLFGGSEQLWQYIKMYAVKAGREATRVVLELYYVVKSPNTPTLDKTIIIAALGYQLLPNDLMSRDKYGWLGLLDNGAALAIAYQKVKKRITPQIEAQVNAVLNQWFGSEQPQTETAPERPLMPSGNDNFDGTYWKSQPTTIPITPESPINTNRPNTPLGGYGDDEDIVID